jgi:site-specific recombinase XerD
MTKKQSTPTPKPLFDTLDQIEEPISDVVNQYLDGIKVKEALEEYQLTLEFLKSYIHSQDTFNSYRREVERLLQWSWLIAERPVKSLTRNECRDYLNFVQAPPTNWIGVKNVARFMDDENILRQFNPDWRPFTVRLPKAQTKNGQTPKRSEYAMSQSSVQAVYASLSSYFNFLMQENYLAANPMQLLRQKNRIIRKVQNQKVTRKLSHQQWASVVDRVGQQADGTPERERLYFMISAFYLLGLRISELAETPGRIPSMGDFAPDKRGLWWFTTVSKGNKIRDVAIPDEMLDILKRYRQSRGLTPLPARDETTPLLHKQRGRGGLGPRQIRLLIQQCFNSAIDKLRRESKTDAANDLEAATVHWLRHTAISDDIEFRPREHVRDDVGHTNPATTDRYIDIDRIARHRSAQNKTLLMPGDDEE